MRVLTQWVLDSYPIVYTDKTIKQYPQASTVRWIRFYCCVPFSHWQSEPIAFFCFVCQYITVCYFITYSTNDSFVYLVEYLLFQLLEKHYQYWPERSDPDPINLPSLWCFGQNAQEAPERDVRYWLTWVQNPIKRRSDALRAFAYGIASTPCIKIRYIASFMSYESTWSILSIELCWINTIDSFKWSISFYWLPLTIVIGVRVNLEYLNTDGFKSVLLAWKKLTGVTKRWEWYNW